MGIALSVEAGRPELLAAAAEACRGWEAEGAPDAKPLRLSLEVGPVDAGEFAVRHAGKRVSITGAGAQGWVDAERGEAGCTVSEAGLCDAGGWCETVLDPLILVLVTRRDRTPVHASAFLAGDLAVLLAGPSGSGKSCLALAAHWAGFGLLSDDTVYVQMRPELRIWSIPRPIHLFAEDAPEGEGGPVRLRNGKRKVALALPPGPPRDPAKRAVLCVLARGRHVELDPLDPAAAQALLGPLEPGFDLLPEQGQAMRESLIRKGAWRLTLGDRPADAIALLSRSLDRLESRAAP